MPNHFHLLLEVSRAPLSRAMQSLLYRYTYYYNRRYRKVGHLFQGRYKAILCDRDNYLMELIRYLHLNPVRAGMVKDPRRYRWSSHGEYLRGRSDLGIAVEHGLKLWGAQRGQALKAYQRFIGDGITAGHQDGYYEVKEQRYLGDDKFVEGVHQTLDDQEATRPVRITMEDVLQEIIADEGVAIGVILNKGRGRKGSRLRAEVAYVGREVGGIGLTEAAKYLGRDPSTMSLALTRLEEGLNTDVKRRKQLEVICTRLRQGRRPKYQISKA